MSHELYMKRCLDLAARGIGLVAPNPMVGAVLVYNDHIIGEGFHTGYGKPHAEVEAIQSVTDADRHLIPESTLFVNLEPCSHFGKTPPCANFILKHEIKKVVVAQQDPNPLVAGNGIRLLKENGVDVSVGILEDEARFFNRRFNTYHEKKRPYIILKWAQTANGFIGTGKNERLIISDNTSHLMVHKWRAQEQAILIGYRTALFDNPQLNVRLVEGKNPIRIVIDEKGTLPDNLNIFNDDADTIVFTTTGKLHPKHKSFIYRKESLVQDLLCKLYELNILSVIVEGGANILNEFIQSENWDEARVIHSPMHYEKSEGIKAPTLIQSPSKIHNLNKDTIYIYYNI